MLPVAVTGAEQPGWPDPGLSPARSEGGGLVRGQEAVSSPFSSWPRQQVTACSGSVCHPRFGARARDEPRLVTSTRQRRGARGGKSVLGDARMAPKLTFWKFLFFCRAKTGAL